MKKIPLTCVLLATISFALATPGYSFTEGTGVPYSQINPDCRFVFADVFLTPYSIDKNKAVTAQKLRDAVLQWNQAWKNKEVSVVAWAGGGLSGSETLHFFSSDAPGLVILEAALSHEEQKKIGTYAAQSQFIVVKGTITESRGRALLLTACTITGAVLNDSVGASKLNPFTLNATEPVRPQDVLASMQAWQGVDVTVRDKCTVPANGNTILFINQKAKADKYGFKPNLLSAVLTTKLKGAQSITAVKTIKGKVNRLEESTGTLSLYGCTLLP
jgi:hypothetical protein